MKASLNYNQSVIFNTVFNENMTMKKDCPREIAFWGGYGSGKSWVSILLAYYYTIPREELYKKLLDRTPGAITKQVFHLRAKGWPFKRCT